MNRKSHLMQVASLLSSLSYLLLFCSPLLPSSLLPPSLLFSSFTLFTFSYRLSSLFFISSLSLTSFSSVLLFYPLYFLLPSLLSFLYPLLFSLLFYPGCAGRITQLQPPCAASNITRCIHSQCPFSYYNPFSTRIYPPRWRLALSVTRCKHTPITPYIIL